jgi:hypothetical protein
LRACGAAKSRAGDHAKGILLLLLHRRLLHFNPDLLSLHACRAAER